MTRTRALRLKSTVANSPTSRTAPGDGSSAYAPLSQPFLLIHPAWLGRQCFSVRIFKALLGNVRKTISFSHLPMRAEPQGAAEIDRPPRTQDGLLAWANFVCSSSVRHPHLSSLCGPSDIVFASSDSPVLGSGRSRKGVFGQGMKEQRISLNSFLQYLSFGPPIGLFRTSRLCFGSR